MLIHSSRAIEVMVVSMSQLLVNQARALERLVGMVEKLCATGVSPRAAHIPSIKSLIGFEPFQ